MASDLTSKNVIFLHYPLDNLLNLKCGLDITSGDKPPEIAGIRLPSDHDPGTGNIIICGKPGTGKSTLALQMAMACVRHPNNRNNFHAAYITLEETPERVKHKASEYGWDQKLHQIRLLHQSTGATSPAALAKLLKCALTQPPKPACPLHDAAFDCVTPCPTDHTHIPSTPYVLLPSLSPRPLVVRPDEPSLFLRRYAELETFLTAARELNSQNAVAGGTPEPSLRMVCIDSLNMFGSQPLNREEIFRLFDLFRRCGIIGVFIVETSQDTPFDSTMADVVIRLTADEDQAYFVRYIEVEKSRYTQHVYGKHLFKTCSKEETTLVNKDNLYWPGIEIFPSLHYAISKTIPKKPVKPTQPAATPPAAPIPLVERGARFDFGIPAFDKLLPETLERQEAVVLEGPMGTFKASCAVNFLAQGLMPGKGPESALLLRLHDGRLFKEKLKFQYHKEPGALLGFQPEDFTLDRNSPLADLTRTNKVDVRVFRKEPAGPCLIEADFKTGGIFPEEFIQIVRDIFRIYGKADGAPPIHRVVLMDVGAIGSSYPFLRESRTTGEMFLPAFTHIMRNLGVDLVMVGTTGFLPECDKQVHRACALANTVISYSCQEIFGDRYVIVKGEGLTSAGETSKRDYVPGVIRTYMDGDNKRYFHVDTQPLRGLAGFETGRVFRPGLSVYLFQENEPLHGRYNREIGAMLRSMLAAQRTTFSGDGQHECDDNDVSILTFDSTESEALHDSLEMLIEKPQERTVIYTCDEFWRKRLRKRTYPYYRNLLLLAYRLDICSPPEHPFTSWKDVRTYANQYEGKRDIDCPFWIDQRAVESYSCILLDALVAGLRQSTINDDQLPNKAEDARSPFASILAQGDFCSDPNVQQELLALHALLTPISEEIARMNWRNPHGDTRVHLPEDSGVYVCWYSQLRELIARRPDLTGKIGFCALPGGGFKGDWYIGVGMGSVSKSLGDDVIELLNHPQEVYKRWARGVGLPPAPSSKTDRTKPQWTHESLRDVDPEPFFYAWRNATRPETSLNSLLQIHAKAMSRASIEGYGTIRDCLAHICRQLAPVGLSIKDTDAAEHVRKVAERLAKQMQFLLGIEEAGNPAAARSRRTRTARYIDSTR